MKFSTFLLGGAAVLALSSASFAADLIIDAPTAVPVVASSSHDWSGFYVGGHLGYGTGVLNLDADVPGIPEDEEDISGFLGGVQLGYNFDLGGVIVGVQTDISASGIASDEDEGGADDTIDWLGSTTARIGVPVDALLPYAKVGIAYGAGTGVNNDVEDSHTHVGWTAGVGLEYAVSDSMSVFAEYDYYALGTETYTFPGANVDVDAGIHAIKAGFNFKF